MIDRFTEYMKLQGKSDNTIDSYSRHVTGYLKWFQTSYGKDFKQLYRQNVLDYKSYMITVNKLSAKSINAKLSAIMLFNEFLILEKLQQDIVVFKQDKQRVQAPYINPAKFGSDKVDNFRQTILEEESERDYAIVTLIAYTGVRISEALALRMHEFNLTTREAIIRHGKGDKQRIIILNDKVVNSIRSFLKVRDKMTYSDSEYLFISKFSGSVHRSVINKLFNKYSDMITPKELRHFFCSHAIENGWSIHEVAAQVGHTNIHITSTYTHPSRDKIKDKANLL